MLDDDKKRKFLFIKILNFQKKNFSHGLLHKKNQSHGIPDQSEKCHFDLNKKKNPSLKFKLNVNNFGSTLASLKTPNSHFIVHKSSSFFRHYSVNFYLSKKLLKELGNSEEKGFINIFFIFSAKSPFAS